MNVPFLDLKKQHEPLRAEIMAAISDVADQSAFAGGKFVTEFENDFAAFCRVKHAIGVGNGTDALWLALKALGVGEGDEVITVPNSFIATGEAISLCGAIPVFVDVTEETMTMDPARLEEAITADTKAIIPVHLYGQMADMDPIMEIAGRHKIPVIEDACQAHGALYKGRRAGTIGVFGAFSFYPGKNLGAYGDAGGVATNDDATALGVRRLRNHGCDVKNHHLLAAGNERLETIQGAVLGVKLPRLDGWNVARRRHVEEYRAVLKGTPGLDFVDELPGMISNYHLFVVRHARRDALLESLRSQGVMADIHYPLASHLQPALGARRGRVGQFPVAEKACAEILSLPLYPELTSEQIARVAAAVRAAARA